MAKVLAVDLFIAIELADPHDGWPVTEKGRWASGKAEQIRFIVRAADGVILQVQADPHVSPEGRRSKREEARGLEISHLTAIQNEVASAVDQSAGARRMYLRDFSPPVDETTRRFVWDAVREMPESERSAFLLSEGLGRVVAAAVLSAPAVPPFNQLDAGTTAHLELTAVGPAGVRQLQAWQADHAALVMVLNFALRAIARATADSGGSAVRPAGPETVDQIIARTVGGNQS